MTLTVELLIASLTLLISRCAGFWRLGILEGKINKNTYDINASREVIQRDVVKRFTKNLGDLDEILDNYSALLSTIKIRLYNIEIWASKSGYERPNTKTDFDD